MKRKKKDFFFLSRLRNSAFYKTLTVIRSTRFSLRIQQSKGILSATIRYATRITTESSHPHHKVQGFHTQNNNSYNNGW